MKLKRKWWKRPDAPLDCREVGAVLQGYLDGELEDADVPLVAAHLEVCRRCGLESAAYDRIKAALAEPMPEGADPEAIQRLRQFGKNLTENGGGDVTPS
ncbi:MAG: anti-sigma factor family protein [Acidimicrobiales bacterium]